MSQLSLTEAEIVVIGAGPGGYPAAFAAADHGKQVTLIDANPRPGGVCLQCGCIPSKALLHIAKLINETRESSHWGVTFAPPKIDLDALRKFKDGVIDKLVGGIGQLQKARGVTWINARATFADSQTLNLAHPDGKSSQLRFQHAILATGSSPAVPGIFQKNDSRIMDSTGALALESIPKR